MSGAVHTVLEHIHRLARAGGGQVRTDRQLLEEFARQHEQLAFADLVRRHGPMVLGVGRRVLGHRQDAEDVLQATFLVLARKAEAVRWGDSVANWLYSVAYRLAQKLRCGNARRHKHLVQATAEPATSPATAGQFQEMQALLDEELQRLPEKYRAPLVLCYLEGKTRDEAALQLGWGLHVVKGRLERGRNLLRQRLTRRGVTLSAALLPVGLLESGASLATPLVTAMVDAAAQIVGGQALAIALSPKILALTQGTLQAMFWTKIKFVSAAVLCLALLGSGAGLVVHRALAGADSSGNSTKDRLDQSAAVLPVAQLGGGDRDQPPKEKAKTVSGNISEIDVKKGTLVLAGRANDMGISEHTYNFTAKDVKVMTNLAQPIKLEDLKLGMSVKLTLSAAKDVTAILVQAPSHKVTIKAVDAAKSTITFDGGDRDEDKTVPVAKDAKLVLDGKDAKLAEFKEKMTGLAMFSFDKTTLIKLRVGKDKDAGRPILCELLSVDKDKNTITFQHKEKTGEIKQTMPLAKDAKISLGRDEDGTLADLKIGSKLIVKLGADEKTVIAIHPAPAPPGIVGFLKRVDAANNTIIVTLKTAGGQEKEKSFTLTKDAKITIPGKVNAKVADLQEGQRVQLQLGEDRMTVGSVQQLKKEEERQE